MRDSRQDMGTLLQQRETSEAGFTLIELLFAAALFVIIGGAAFELFAQHQPLFNQQQNQAALNISMRNAIAQMQVDIVNGGSGYYNGINIPSWPVGVVINNNVVASGGACNTGTTYGANCFDSFTTIVSDPNTTPVNPLAGASSSLPVTPGTCATNTTVTSSTTSLYVLPPTGVTAATYAANFYSGDQILLVNRLRFRVYDHKAHRGWRDVRRQRRNLCTADAWPDRRGRHQRLVRRPDGHVREFIRSDNRYFLCHGLGPSPYPRQV